MAGMHLFRGVSIELHKAQSGELRPKKQFAPFTSEPKFGQAEFGNSFWGDTPLNAIIEHQQHQAGLPTSGVSTTPHFERARFYATCGGTRPGGVIYVIDRDLCSEHGVALYTVNELVPQPSVPDDD